MRAPFYYTTQTLAEACGVSVRTINQHVRANTLRLNAARQKIPGLGIRYQANLCERFVAAMQARHKPKEIRD